MLDNENKNVLKGQYNLAQGKRRRSVALGGRTGGSIVRAIRIKKEKFLFRTKEMIAISRQIMPFYSVRKKFFAINIMFSRTVFVMTPFT
jgi:hypothetical protein